MQGEITNRPVVVEVAELVGEALLVVRGQVGAVVDDVVVGGGDGALAHRLAHHEEVIPVADICIHSSNLVLVRC